MLVLIIFPITSSMRRIWIWSPFWISIILEVWKVCSKHRLDVANIMSKMKTYGEFCNSQIWSSMILDESREVQEAYLTT